MNYNTFVTIISGLHLDISWFQRNVCVLFGNSMNVVKGALVEKQGVVGSEIGWI